MNRDVRFWLAVWFGAGLVPRVPGTAGSLAALPLALLLSSFGIGVMLLAAMVLTLVGVWAAHAVAAQTRQHDPQIVVIDEVAGQVLTCAAVAGARWPWWLAAFVVFRLLDQWKPWPIRRMEQLHRPGWAIMLDDVVAGAIGALGLWLARS